MQSFLPAQNKNSWFVVTCRIDDVIRIRGVKIVSIIIIAVIIIIILQ